MGFIRAGFQSLKDVWQDGKFKEFVAIPEVIENEVLVIKGTLHETDPDGVRRQSNNKTTGLLSDGSLIFVPQGYVAIAINNGQFLSDAVFQPGIYTWDTKSNQTLFFSGEGMFKSIRNAWNQFKDRFQYGGQVVAQQEIVYVKCQPIMGVKFGTTNGVEYMSPIYRNLSIRFYGICDIFVDDPITFFVQIASRKLQDGVYRFSEIAETLRRNLPTTIAVSLSQYAAKHNTEVPGMNTVLLEVGDESAKSVTLKWSELYGLGLSNLVIEDISYDERSQKIVDEFDEILRKTSDPKIAQYEAMHRHYDVMEKMAANEAKGESFNALAGVAMMPAMMGMVGGAMSQQMQNPYQNTGYPNNQPVQPNQPVAPTPQVVQPETVQPAPQPEAQSVSESANTEWEKLKAQMNETPTSENDDPLGLLNK